MSLSISSYCRIHPNEISVMYAQNLTYLYMLGTIPIVICIIKRKPIISQ